MGGLAFIHDFKFNVSKGLEPFFLRFKIIRKNFGRYFLMGPHPSILKNYTTEIGLSGLVVVTM